VGDRGEGPERSAPSPPADPVAAARQICLNQLEHAPRTRAELAAVLRRKGVEATSPSRCSAGSPRPG